MADVTTLSGRIDWIRERLGQPGKPISARGLARATKVLTEPSITMLLRRLKEKPDASMTPETARLIAQAGGVNREWLLTGKGPRDESAAAFPAALALALARFDWPERLSAVEREAIALDAAKVQFAEEKPGDWDVVLRDLVAEKKGKAKRRAVRDE